MRKILGLAAIAVLVATQTLANPLASVFGKVITIADANGATLSQTIVNADGTYSTTPAGGTAFNGTWEVKADADGVDRACFASTNAQGNPTEVCSAELLGKSAGDTYSIADSQGNTSTVTIGN